MSKIYVMRRANGEFFTVLPNRVAVWNEQENLEISRAHNRDLDLYQPVLITDKVAIQIKNKFSIQGSCSAWLVEPQSSKALLKEGRLIDWSEVENLRSQADPEPEKVETPKVRATIQEFQFN